LLSGFRKSQPKVIIARKQAAEAYTYKKRFLSFFSSMATIPASPGCCMPVINNSHLESSDGVYPSGSEPRELILSRSILSELSCEVFISSVHFFDGGA